MCQKTKTRCWKILKSYHVIMRLIVNKKTIDYLNQSLKSWDLEESFESSKWLPNTKPLMSSWGFFWLNIDCASSQVGLIHLWKFLTQGTCPLTPSPDNTTPPPPSYFGDLEWARGEGSPIVISHFGTASQWRYCQKALHFRKLLKFRQN